MTPRDKLGRVSALSSVSIGASNELGAFESGVTGELLGSSGHRARRDGDVGRSRDLRHGVPGTTKVRQLPRSRFGAQVGCDRERRALVADDVHPVQCVVRCMVRSFRYTASDGGSGPGSIGNKGRST